ncbi:MAG: toxin-antitoxin system protein [Burkholderiales bacterium PBB3]|nr:MAG: toxin-antitoxin system protein [Burkholderiales bacterium PBB3]
MRDIAINLRARSDQRDLIDRAASSLGRNRSDFMLEAACEKAQSIVLDSTFFSLDGAAFARFSALLDAPIQPNPALDRLMARQPLWEK